MKSLKYTVRTMFYSAVIGCAVVIPQAIAHTFNAPITL